MTSGVKMDILIPKKYEFVKDLTEEERRKFWFGKTFQIVEGKSNYYLVPLD